MTPKRQRLLFAVFGVGLLVAATLLMMNAFRDHVVFFYTPSDLQHRQVAESQLIRIGGLVEQGSVAQDGRRVTFIVTDLTATLPVHYEGILPALFREGQGVVAEGRLRDGALHAAKLLAKHDENYMPPEVAEALQKSGRWRHGAEVAPESLP
jgi:cytochrome c-type biogenesis protein CcmE